MSIGIRYAQQGLMPAYSEVPPIKIGVSLPYGGTRQTVGQNNGGAPFLMGTAISLLSITPQPEIRTLTLSGASGNVILTLSSTGGVGQITFAYNALVSAVMTAVVTAFPEFGNGNLIITGTPGTSYVFTFANELNNQAIGGNWASSVTAGTATWTTTQQGSSAAQYDSYNATTNNNPVDGFLVWDVRTGFSGSRLSKDIGGQAVNQPYSWPAFFEGTFNASDLIGLDANAFAITPALAKRAGGLLVQIG
jgi:hypothetical protein